jgi:hypothetical protein
MYTMSQLHKQLILHILHIYRLNMKNVNISLTIIIYKTHINIVLCTMMRSRFSKCEMFLLGKNISMRKKILMLQSSSTCTYVTFHLHKQLLLHTLHIYKLNMKNISRTISTITYKRHINIVLCTMIIRCSS